MIPLFGSTCNGPTIRLWSNVPPKASVFIHTIVPRSTTRISRLKLPRFLGLGNSPRRLTDTHSPISQQLLLCGPEKKQRRGKNPDVTLWSHRAFRAAKAHAPGRAAPSAAASPRRGW